MSNLMYSSPKHAFIDECGNFGTDFRKKGNSSHYIITAIIVDYDNVSNLRNSVENIREKFFGRGEIKSSKVSHNHSRRIKILDEIVKLDFKIVTLVINKTKINYTNSGLKYKKSFIKYLNNLLHQELRLLYSNLIIYADEHGRDSFMKSFEEYSYKQHKITIFDRFDFSFIDSKNEPLVQLADFISGTLSYGFESIKKCSEYQTFYSLLKQKINILREWPITSDNYEKNLEIINEGVYDKAIAKYCIRSSINYVKDNRNKKNYVIFDRVNTVQYMLNNVYLDQSKKYIYSDELIMHLQGLSSRKYTKHSFMAKIIAPLRDSGVIISSSSNGYKIPVSEKELYSYSNKTMAQIMPMLERLNNARKRVLSATDNKFDILSSEEHSKIRRYFSEIHNKFQ